MKPAVWMERGEHTPLRVVPPFLQEREGTVCFGYDVFQTVRTDREGGVFSGSI